MTLVNAREEILLSAQETRAAIHLLADQICADITQPKKRVMVGIRRGGAVVAQLLRERLNPLLGLELPMGSLDITFYRDDLRTIGPNPVVGATDLTMQIDDKRIILVDDVLFTGRTIRAALNALFDYGRPEAVDLVVLVDRGGRQLPIQPDYAGHILATGGRDSIKLVESQPGEWHLVRRWLE
ncbi:MAG: bifunctional pyr operon transcriptional regulator/uracil phosphoribosyltransferase PyrR [Magnetococcus sp. YQC-5]